MRSDYDEVRHWLAAQEREPSQNWQGLCLKAARTAWGLPVVAPSAREWWAKVPEDQRHHAHAATDVPAGAMCYAPLGRYGHVWVMVRDGHAYSTDYFRRGRIDFVRDGALQHWTGTERVWWTAWSPQGHLPVERHR